MSLESVARLAKLAASDSGVLSALQNDPVQIRKPLELSDAQLHALISASSFTTSRPVHTTSQPEAPVGNPADLMQLGTLGTLLPPEGSGAFPTPADLPPPTVAPKTIVPVHVAPSPSSGPKTTPAAPQSRGPAPASPSPVWVAPSPRSSTPQAAPTTRLLNTTPAPSGQTPGAPGSAVIPGSQQGSGTISSGAPQSSGQAAFVTTSMQFTQARGNTAVPGGYCGCDVGMVALTAELSATAQAALTAITTIAGLD